ncbi:mechanosensitive ion channel domain-containing protein [Marinobacterium rhizophilum]|uniref:Small-conductance mechanosensitive channel n=1 Tax=Marinobacterium rhizophilum TaxID=420402 RepID=A0ABY5HLZ3_9GAMM|nr:mechanosensitive ion channel domain-containing protein [Marinobacterium rhizophilum]UTW13411.1 mechanosensitive ion channel [Marinobacterium rhizophilum]
MYTQLLATLGVILGYFVVFGLVRKLIRSLGQVKRVPAQRVIYINKYFNGLCIFTTLVLVSLIWSVDYSNLMLFASSIFAIVGVALFAQWSILSNVTSSIIIFFAFPARIGHRIRILDDEETIIGEIVEITFFQVLLRGEKGETIAYPNNLLLQKPVILLSNGNSNDSPKSRIEPFKLP